MNSQNGYYNQWPSSQPPDRRFLPVAGNFGNEPPPNLSSPNPHGYGQQFPVQFPQGQFILPQQLYAQPQSHFTPLIPLSAVEDLQLPQVPFTAAGLPESSSRAPFAPFATSGPVVHEGYIPAPGRNDEDDYPEIPEEYRNQLYSNRNFDSSDDRSGYEDEITFEEQMRRLETRDDSEVDKDYSEEDAREDAGDPEELELEVEFEDEEERTRPKRGKPAPRGAPIAISAPVATDGSVKISRGGRRGRPPTRGRGGHSGSASTRGRKPKGPGSRGSGREKGKRGPRTVADPGHEFKSLQRKANERFIAQDYAAALVFAEQAITLNPEIFDAHNTVSEIYAAMGDEAASIDALIIGAPTKRDPELWQFILQRIQKLDGGTHSRYDEAGKTAIILGCLKQIILLDKDNYEARSHVLEIEAQLGHSSKCVKLGQLMLNLRKAEKKAPDTEVLKTMAMMGTSSAKQTKLHLERLLASFDEAIEYLTRKSADTDDLDWELINIYLDLLDKSGQYDFALHRLKALARWKQGRSKETFWDEEEDDREYDIEDEPRRVAVTRFKREEQNAKYGQTLPLEIRVKLGIFRLRKGASEFAEAMVRIQNVYMWIHSNVLSTTSRC
jgi:general transcription factor 3C polypeptide 3 (transcription factor C subunit 4)